MATLSTAPLIKAAGFISRHVPLPRGRTRLMRMLARHAPSVDLSYRDPSGYVRLASLADPMEAHGFFGLTRLPHEVRDLVLPGDWVIDIGANVGLLAGELCARVGPTGAVWAIEPLPRNVRRLEEFGRANSLAQLMIFELALADVPGTARLKLPAGAGSGWGSFTASWNTGEVITVTTSTLDHLTEDLPSGRRLALVKIDVEGAEPLVLAGAARTLRTMRPWVLCEFNEPVLRDAGSSADQLLAQFARLGYRPAVRIAPGGLDILLRPE